MMTRRRTKYIHDGRHVAAVEVLLLEDDTGWSPYLSVEDACRLDDVRDALRRGDLATAARLADVFELTPVVLSP